MDQAVEPRSRDRVSRMFRTGAEMGLTVCRSWAFNDDTYNALQVSPGHFDERIFKEWLVAVKVISSWSGSVIMLMFDPYLNTDASTMSPFEHDEVSVLDNGAFTHFTFLGIKDIKIVHSSYDVGVILQTHSMKICSQVDLCNFDGLMVSSEDCVLVGQGYGLTETCAGAAFIEWDDTTSLLLCEGLFYKFDVCWIC
ncbi:hypothetical protein ZEAMMB73_Zm00001d035984 [Zea mays]|uniref:CTP synthase N-terminal domain-containing protein n=1 Tax=Zea mays TaxID=4577 RepID=A0A1D6LK14_MAIZE|nr:hypothetical protein ZEAMMB73_Zm00001d035984 [Zea mays]